MAKRNIRIVIVAEGAALCEHQRIMGRSHHWPSGALLFHLLSKLHEQTSVITTTNLSSSE